MGGVKNVAEIIVTRIRNVIAQLSGPAQGSAGGCTRATSAIAPTIRITWSTKPKYERADVQTRHTSIIEVGHQGALHEIHKNTSRNCTGRCVVPCCRSANVSTSKLA